VGLDGDALAFLIGARRSGVSFERSATLGRQYTAVSGRRLVQLYAAGGLQPGRPPRVFRGYAEPILRDLGAREVVSIDASAYEGATCLHDLNHPIPDCLADRFSMVLDSGTLEHIFNFPVAIRNCMRMVKEGGHLLLVTPTNNEAGHGFYQFSPELLFRVLAPEFGFNVEQMLLREVGLRRKAWYEVADPGVVCARAQYRTRSVAYLYVRARRVGPVPAFDPAPQQSDYAARWREDWHPLAEPRGIASLLRAVGRRAPQLEELYLRWRPGTRGWYRRHDYRHLPTHFRRVRPW
jgi:SAM-dependent methyltransferase